ncbi:MAG TPA: SIS domain-containing protein [Acidimicrobiales bacterium]|nr:SIS domain-containing protein [Acidimicrobiales bacterium]
MCGIVAVLARPARRPPPAPSSVLASLAEARDRLAHVRGSQLPEQLEGILAAASSLGRLDEILRGVPGLTCLLGDASTLAAVQACVPEIQILADSFESALDAGVASVEAGQAEVLNVALVKLRDALWAIGHDRVEAARGVGALAGALGLDGEGPPGLAALGVLWSLHVALSSLDRLEVRGRDSAGVHLMLTGHGLDPDDGRALALLEPRSGDVLFKSGAARAPDGVLSLVYKTAKAIGELGDNVASLREAISKDRLLALVLGSPEVEGTVVAHTRWASVGAISEPNAHPLNSEEDIGDPHPYVVGALNGDIDNCAQLLVSEGFLFPGEVTTDAKLVPTVVSRRLSEGLPLHEAWRKAVGCFEGSVGVVANASSSPGDLLLALRGSGQSLNIGLAEDAFVIASEPYGVVEETNRYLRMDGEAGGQVVVCSREGAGALSGLSRWRYSGEVLPVAEEDLATAEITTRDVDRRGFKHFLLKEISEAPSSVRKTLRGKLFVGENGHALVNLGEDVIPLALRKDLAAGRVRQISVIGQGTAAVAGQAVAHAIARVLPQVPVKAMPATELSGWGPAGSGLPDDMSGTLVIAISQSGTTTDTNRTVDLCRARGAHIVSIVNRRNSDLVQKSQGVLYTSDGRDVEMSVASTKAFYSQVVAGNLLAAGLASGAQGEGVAGGDELLRSLRDLPELMQKVLEKRGQIARVASMVAPSRRSWAVVGSGPDKVAAAEIRIKLSELCYKAIGLDSVEDKKHIDLSAEPLIVVCAGSVSGPNARDIAKEVEIFRAHKAAPVVIVAEGQEALFSPIADVLSVPPCPPEIGFVLTAMVGHLFGYEAALSIDSQATPLREARVLVSGALGEAPSTAGGPVRAEGSALTWEMARAPLGQVAPQLEVVTRGALSGLRSGAYDGHLNASTATRLTSLLRYGTGELPVEGYEAEMGKVGTPAAIAADLLDSLGAAIDELTRPIDAIKHQAKTVTVGISRSEEPLLRAKLVAEALAAGASVGSLGYRALRTLAALGAAVDEVLGYTRYRVMPGEEEGLQGATITVVDRGGIAVNIPSRTATDNHLRGTKHRAAEKREVTVFRGLHDGRTGVMVPEVKDAQVTGLTLLHARFAERLSPDVAKSVLSGYQGRYTALVDAVTEANPHFDEEVLGQISVVDLFTEPVAVLARYWSPAPERG